jgi:hypothetical protein
MNRSVALLFGLLSNSAGTTAAGVKEPSWNFTFPGSSGACVDASANGNGNTRWVYTSLPAGQPPAAGWPVWLSLVTDTFPAPKGSTATCGKGGGGHYSNAKAFDAFATPLETMKTCFEPPPPPLGGPYCGYEMRKYCEAEEKEGAAKCQACATAHSGELSKACTPAEITAICSGKGPSPSPWPPHHRSNCDYDQEAGALWDQRLKQYLVANGVAVVAVNPFEEDSWCAGFLLCATLLCPAFFYEMLR